MNRPVDVLSPDPKIMAQIDEILRQNALVLKMNQDLLGTIIHPLLSMDPREFRIDLEKVGEISRKGA